MESASARPIVALVADLIFQSKIAGVAAHLGIEVRFERSVAGAASCAVECAGVLVDLTVDEIATVELIRELRMANPTLRLIGFFPHVQSELARRARAAGANLVLTRSKFTERLPDLLRELLAQNPVPHWPVTTDPL